MLVDVDPPYLDHLLVHDDLFWCIQTMTEVCKKGSESGDNSKKFVLCSVENQGFHKNE